MGFWRVSEDVDCLGGGSHVTGRAVGLISVELVSLHLPFQDLLHLQTGIRIVDGIKAVETLQALVGRIIGDASMGIKVVSVIIPHPGWRF